MPPAKQGQAKEESCLPTEIAVRPHWGLVLPGQEMGSELSPLSSQTHMLWPPSLGAV